MADWNTPTLSSIYSDFLSYMKDRDVDIAKQFDGTTSTNVPTGAIKWNSTSNRWNKWDGSAWQELTTSYGFNSVTLPNGTANGVTYLNGSKVLTSGSALTFDGTNLGLGTTSPSYGIDVKGSSLAGSSIRVGNSGNSFGLVNQWDNSSGLGNVFTLGAYPIAFGINNSEQMRLTSTGLGIGTSSTSSAKLNIANSSSLNEIMFLGTNYTNIFSETTSGLQFGISATANTAAIEFYTNGTEKMRLDSSGNLGLGVTPSAWATVKALQVANGSMWGISPNDFGTAQNAYFNSGWKYISSSSPATLYAMTNGIHQWQVAPSGTAGNAISFTQAMTLDASGRLGVGTSNPFGVLHATNNDPTAVSRIIIGTGGGSTAYNLYSSGGYQAFETGGNERMRIDSSGNLLLGTTTQSGKLTVSGSGTLLSIIGNSGGAVADDIKVSRATAGGTSVATNSWIQLWNSTDGKGCGMQLVDNGPVFWGHAGGWVQLARMTAGGYFYLNCTGQTGDAPNTAGGHVKEPNGNTKVRVSLDNTTAFQFYSPTGGTGSPVGSIYIGTTSTAYNTSSDYRLKENIQPMQGALATVAQLNPVTYTWKADGSDGQGFIAHELQAVVPDCVTGEKDAVDAEGNPVYQGIDTSFLVATLTKALQEAHGLIKDLEARVAVLEAK